MLWISLCVARVRKDCTSHCGMCPSGFRQAIRGKRSGTLNPPCEMPGRQLALLWVCLWKSCSHSPLKKCLRRLGERHWTEPQDFSRLAKEPGKRCCGMRHDGASRNCGQRIHPWRRRACFRRSPRTFLESRKTQYSWASWRLKGKSWRHFHGHSRSAGFLWKSCWQTVPEAGRRAAPGIRPTRGLAGRDRPAVLLRTAVDILWIKLLAKCWRKCLARSRPWPAGLAVFCPSPMLRKSPGRSAREASQGPGWAPDTLWITL